MLLTETVPEEADGKMRPQQQMLLRCDDDDDDVGVRRQIRCDGLAAVFGRGERNDQGNEAQPP
jgi:hypothetical protein